MEATSEWLILTGGRNHGPLNRWVLRLIDTNSGEVLEMRTGWSLSRKKANAAFDAAWDQMTKEV